MARPAKRNCDYFPHFVCQGRDLYFIETRFGIEGYYFYYRLREFLCQCDHITYRIEYEADLEYLYRYFALDKAKVEEMIDACADIDHSYTFELTVGEHVVHITSPSETVSLVVEPAGAHSGH